MPRDKPAPARHASRGSAGYRAANGDRRRAPIPPRPSRRARTAGGCRANHCRPGRHKGCRAGRKKPGDRRDRRSGRFRAAAPSAIRTRSAANGVRSRATSVRSTNASRNPAKPGQQQPGVDPERRQRRRQRRGDIAEPARLDPRIKLGADVQDPHRRPICHRWRRSPQSNPAAPSPRAGREPQWSLGQPTATGDAAASAPAAVAARSRSPVAHRPGCREPDHDPRAPPFFAVDRERPAMQLGQPPRQRQPEAGAFAVAREPGIHLAERLDRDLDLSRGHAQAGVADFEFDTAIGGAVHRQHHGPAGLGEFDRIAEQVQQNLFQPGLVCDQPRQPGLDLGREGEPCRRGALADEGDAAIGESARIETAILVRARTCRRRFWRGRGSR